MPRLRPTSLDSIDAITPIDVAPVEMLGFLANRLDSIDAIASIGVSRSALQFARPVGHNR